MNQQKTAEIAREYTKDELVAALALDVNLTPGEIRFALAFAEKAEEIATIMKMTIYSVMGVTAALISKYGARLDAADLVRFSLEDIAAEHNKERVNKRKSLS